MTHARYLLLDVFTNIAYAGNQLAVFPDVAIDDASMQRIARELNLSETVFVERGDGDHVAKLRIFTPAREMPFAGHPTIGAALALVEHLRWVARDADGFALRLRVGDIPIRVDFTGTRATAWLTTPPVNLGETVDAADASALLCLSQADLRDDLPSQIASAGNPFLFVPLRTTAAVDRARCDESVFAGLGLPPEVSGVYLFAQTPGGAYARMFAPMSGVTEDPATGSAAGPLYAYLAEYGALPRAERFTNEQGVAMGRRSVIHVHIEWSGALPVRIDIGGEAVLVGEGTLRLP